MVELLEANIGKQVFDLIEDAKSITIIPSKVAGADAFNAAAGLYHMLSAQDKDVSLRYTGKWPEGSEGVIKEEQVDSDLLGRELLVTIDYSNTQAAKVHYSTDNDVLTLKVAPVNKDFDPSSRVKARISGFDLDVVFVIGAQELADLGQVFHEMGNSLRDSRVINIDNSSRNTRFGVVNVVDPSADSLSMVVYKYAVEWGLIPNTRAAKALLAGMTYRQNGVDSK
jgi:nanoRNase/pAp phosphatase (c-di-AMP/oligoRNAs hydrolase)